MYKLTAKILCGYMLALLIMAGISLAPAPALAAPGCCIYGSVTSTDQCDTTDAKACLAPAGGGQGGSCGTCASGGTGTTTPTPTAGSLTNPLSGACGKLDASQPNAGQTCIQLIIGNVIKAALGIVGSIALLMMTYGGYRWLTAMGNSERVEKGKDTLIWAVLGLVVIFGAYAITSYVIDKLVAGK
jgi:hypothetical protein